MKVLNLTIFLLLIIGLPILAQDDLVEVEIPISQSTEEQKNQKLEITWLRKATHSAGKTEPVNENPLVRAIESKYRFFRIRSNNATLVSKVYPVAWFITSNEDKKYIVSLHRFDSDFIRQQSLFKKLQTKSGEERSYLVADEVKAEDVGLTPGGDTIFYQINEFGYRIYSSPVTFNADGFYNLRFFSENNMGKTQSMKQLQFWRDKTPPQSQVVFSTQARYVNDVFTLGNGSEIILRSEDAISGVKQVFYSFENKKETFLPYEDAIKLSGKDFEGVEKQVELYYYATDQVGNEEEPQKAIFNFDNRPPEIKLAYSQKILRGDLYRLILGLKVNDISRPITVETWVDGKVVDRKQSGDYHQIVANVTQNPKEVEIVAKDALGNERRFKKDIRDLKEERLP